MAAAWSHRYKISMQPAPGELHRTTPPEKQPSNSGSPRWWFRPVAAILAIIVAVGLAECVLRFLEPPRTNIYSVAAPTGNQYEFYQFDPVLGWSNAPNTTGTFHRAENTFPVRINHYGMRDPEVSLDPPTDRQRIAMLGDSFVWGIGVADEERFTELLAANIHAEVLNFGVSGYGPLQHLLILDRVLEFRPAIVVVAFCLANDYSDNVFRQRYGYFKPYARVDDQGELVIDGYPFPNVNSLRTGSSFATGPWTRMLLAHSAIYRRLASYRNSQNQEKSQAGLIDFDEKMFYEPQDKLTLEQKALRDKAVLINKLVLAKIYNRIQKAGAKMVLLAVPTKFEYPPDGKIRRESVDALAATAREIGIPFIDPVNSMSIDDFWQLDAHWNLGGHMKIAKILADWLQNPINQ